MFSPRMQMVIAAYRKVLHLELGITDLSDEKIESFLRKLHDNNVVIGMEMDISDPEMRKIVRAELHEQFDKMMDQLDNETESIVKEPSKFDLPGIVPPNNNSDLMN